LFWLRYRLDANVRKDYQFKDGQGWTEVYGRLQRTYQEEETAHFSAKQRKRESVTELPGISPAVYRRLLPTAIFARISDLGWQLPAYGEEIVRLEMTPAQSAQYHWLYATLRAEVETDCARLTRSKPNAPANSYRVHRLGHRYLLPRLRHLPPN
jgi:hypothetical protein